jgi:hypothetical protein
MTKRILRGLLMAWAALVGLSLISISALADDSEPCSNATLRGSYAFTESGSIVGIGPVALAGVFKADGQGNITATATVSLNGEIISENLNFTYQVNPDCTGSASSAPKLRATAPSPTRSSARGPRLFCGQAIHGKVSCCAVLGPQVATATADTSEVLEHPDIGVPGLCLKG